MVNELVSSYASRTYEGYNASVASFSKISTAFTSARSQVGEMKSLVQNCKACLVSQKRNLRELRFQQIKHLAIIEILDKFESCLNAPKKIDALLEENGRATEAAELLRASLDASFGEELGRIGAIMQTRGALLEMKPIMQERLIRMAWDHLCKYRRRNAAARKRSSNYSLVSSSEYLFQTDVELRDILGH